MAEVRAGPKPERQACLGGPAAGRGPGMRGWLSPGTPHSSQNYTNYPVLFGKSSFFFQSSKTRSTEEDPMEGGSGRAPGCHSKWRPVAGWSPGGLLLEMAATLTRCLKTSCSIVVFTGPGLCLPRPGRRTRRPRTTEGGFLPAPGEGQRALRLGLQPNDKTSGDILT